MDKTKIIAHEQDQTDWLADAYQNDQNIKEGEIIEGKIIDITKDSFIIDIGLKSEGIIPLTDFSKEDKNFKIGDKIEVLLIKKETKSGQVILSYEQARKIKIWERLARAFQEKGILSGVITKRVKGGVKVDLGLEAFMPISQVGLAYTDNNKDLVGQNVRVKIIELDRDKENIVISQRIVLEEEIKKKKEQLWATLSEQQTMRGVVKNITDFGAFIDLGGEEGLLHINDISWKPVKKVNNVLKMGEEIEVKILNVDRINGKISLGLKQLTPDPWLEVSKKYPTGAIVWGKIVGLVEFGAFVELEEGVEGLVHISEMSWANFVKHPSQVVKKGDVVQVKILNVDEEKRRISLGLKQVQPNPWEEANKKYPCGTKINGIVTHLTGFGAFVKLEEGLEGLIHVSDLSWKERISHPRQVLRVGDKVEAVVLKITPEEEKISLGLKQIQPNPFLKYKVGDSLEVKISDIFKYGIFVELEPGLKGFIHVSQLASDYIPDPAKILSLGELVWAKIIKVDEEESKLHLSIKEYEKEMRKTSIEKYTLTKEQNVTLGDILGDQLSKFVKS